jgi:beta-glucosidase
MANRAARRALFCALVLGLGAGSAGAAEPKLACAPFTTEAPVPPAPRGAASAVKRFEAINNRHKTEPHRVLFLGDSLTERFPQDAPQVWREHMEPRGVFNAGVNGDRTENLLWRLEHGNLDGPAPQLVVVLIGTNDLTNGGHPRSPELTAEGIRANLAYLRRHLPQARILLLGLLPRGASPEARLRRDVAAVNDLIGKCGDGAAIVYADIGDVLLDSQKHLSREVAPDLLHFSEIGYARLMPRLDALIDRLAPR